MPSLSVAPTGMSFTISVSRLFGDASPLALDRLLAVAPRSSAIAVSSLPCAVTGFRYGARGATFTSSLALAVLTSWSVAVTVRVKLVSFGGMIFRSERFQLFTSIKVLPLVAVKLFVQSVSTAPTGMPLTTSDCTPLLRPGRLFAIAEIVPRAIVVPSMPLSACGDHVTFGGVSSTVTACVASGAGLPAVSETSAVTV